MARAESASASAHSDSIKGLAQAVAKTRLSAAAHRRAVAAPRGTGSDRRLPGDARHRRGRRHPRAAPPGAREIRRRSRADRDRRRRAHRSPGCRREGRARDARLPRFRTHRLAGRDRGRPHGAADRRKQHHHRDAAAGERLYRPQAQRGDRPRSRDAAIATSGRASPDVTLLGRIAPPARAARHQSAARPARDHAAPRGGARRMARRHHARRHAVLGDRLRGADARLRVPVAVAPDARDRHHRGHRAQPHRHRAQPRPLRPVGLGPRARPHLLVAVDVRHSRPAAAQQAARLRRDQRAGASRRRAALRACDPARRRRAPRRSTARSACATRAATGSGCGRAASWCASRASRIRT